MNPLIKIAEKYYNQGLLEEASDICRDILKDEPDNAEVLNFYGNIMKKNGDIKEACRSFIKAVSVNPSYAPARDSFGQFLMQARELEKAREHFEAAVKLDGNNPDYLDNLGAVYHETGRIEEAEQLFRKVLDISPDRAVTYSNLAATLLEQEKPKETVAMCDKSLSLLPDDADTLMNRATAVLMTGDYLQGFKDYECRWDTSDFINKYKKRDIPRWNGEDISGKTLLIKGEQGIGDQINFARYIPMLADRKIKVVFECHKTLHRLFDCFDIKTIEMGEEVKADFQMPLLSLPVIFNTDVDTVPNNIPYIKLPDRTKKIKSDKFKIGIVWAGKMFPRDRSCPFSFFREIIEEYPFDFYSFQKGDRAEDIAGFSNITDLSAEFSDFYDTASFMLDMDMVISVDTAAFHLAGALGLPVWGLLIYGADWRYALDREKTLWYPTAKLFRQPQRGDWRSVFNNIRKELDIIKQ